MVVMAEMREVGLLRRINYQNPTMILIFLLVVNKQLNNDLISEIKKHIKSCISIRWIDLSQIRLNKLKKLKNSIFNYDLKNASKVLYGNKKLQNLIPNLKPSEIPLKDIDILFKTRLLDFSWLFRG